MPLQETSGNLTTDAFGGGVAVVPYYIEDMFSTWLYTGTSATQTITNGIDLSTKGGMVWIKGRTGPATYHALFNTAKGANYFQSSNNGDAYTTDVTTLNAFSTTGFQLGDDTNNNYVNTSSNKYVSWTFRKQPKFFDVVTYTGDGTGDRQIAHSLGSVPGCIMIKSTSGTGDWNVRHRSIGPYGVVKLNTTGASVDVVLYDDTSTTFRVDGNFNSTYDSYMTNRNGVTYVAYLFAHNAGGFGLTGTDNVISCGSFTTDGSGNGSVTLGYEPQFLITKGTDGGTNWNMVDTMRGATADGVDSLLRPNLSNAEISASNCFKINSTGFSGGSNILSPSTAIIYIAIRRGPMKVPTTGTSVFKPAIRTGTGASATVTGVGFSPDLVTSQDRGATGFNNHWQDRLRGPSGTTPFATDLSPQSTSAETSQNQALITIDMDGVTLGTGNQWNYSGEAFVNYYFRRAPSFFDEVCYTGDGTVQNNTHNLGAVPELMIVKSRGSAQNWTVYSAATGNTKYLTLNSDVGASSAASIWNNTSPTSSQFTIGTYLSQSQPYVAYLFATCAGVSKVGSYTGNGTTQTIACGFTSGARFVLIKRTDATGDWYVYDTARGMTTLTDPYLLLNTTAAETATLGSVTTVSTGFALNATILAAINTNAASYIFLAVA
jgi:hypothetical protein